MLVSDYFLSSIRGQLLFCCFLDLLTQATSQLSPAPVCYLQESFLREEFSVFQRAPKFTLPVSFLPLNHYGEKFNKFTNSKGRKNFSCTNTWQECRAGINNNAKDFTWTSLEVLWCLRIYLLISALSDFFNWCIYHFILFCKHAKPWGEISV